MGQPQLPESEGRHLREEKDGGKGQILWINCPELPLISKPGRVQLRLKEQKRFVATHLREMAFSV